MVGNLITGTSQVDFQQREYARTQTHTPEEAINQKFLKFLKMPVTTAENQVVAAANQVATGREQAFGGDKPGSTAGKQGKNLSLSVLEDGA